MSPGLFWQHVYASCRHLTLSLCFGLSLIALVWTVTLTRIRVEGAEALVQVERTTENLARVFEENVIRTIGEVDKTLRIFAAAHQRGGTLPDFKAVVADPDLTSEWMLSLSVADRWGNVVAASTAGPGSVAEREFFRIHADSRTDGLFISKPILSLTNGKWQLHFSRRLTDSDGGFGGVVVASIDPYAISRFYGSIEVGRFGTISLVGTDGIIRAGGVRQDVALGLDIAQEPFFARFRQQEQGTVVLAGQVPEPDRILSFRKVGAYPLFVTVATERPRLSFRPSGSLSAHILGSMALTLVVIATMIVSIRHNQRLESARLSLVASEGALRARSRELQLTLNNIDQGILMVDPEGDVAVVNRRAAELLEIPAETLSGGVKYRELIDRLHRRGEFGDLPPHVLDYIHGKPGAEAVLLYERVRPNGAILEVRTTPLPDGGFVRTFTDITDRRRSEARIVHLARHDSLTDLANRVVFRHELEAVIARGHGSFAVLGIDLDRFKVVNDTAGHPVGDRLLKMVARRLQATIRDGDIAARLGGDEFAVIQMDCSSPEVASSLAHRICQRLGEPYEIDGKTVYIGASVGIATADGSSADAMLKAADLALYAAKSEGRGTYRFFDPEMNARFDARRQLEDSLREAVAAERLEVYYQPKIDVATRRVSGFEALLRWNDPQRGFVPPSEFVPIAEELGLIVEIGAWVLERACRDVAQLTGGVGIAVNLSSAQFRSGELIATVEHALANSGLDPSRLELEITESLLLERDEKTLEQLYALRKLGVRVSMDDFGTGYSSLSYLLSFPFDRIKIDRSFVRQLSQGGPSVAIIRAIVGLARSLGIATTAEGVEAEEQLDVLHSLGCTEAQGYAFGRPAPASVAFAILTKTSDKHVDAA